jgi:hypothetical protein
VRPVDGRCPEGSQKIWERLVDGGYFENSGLATLSDMMGVVAPKGARRNVFVIVIDNSAEPPLACPPKDWPWANGPHEDHGEEVAARSGLTAPIETFLSVREARATQEIHRLRSELPCKNQQLIDWSLFGEWDALEEANKAHQQPPLGWFLSSRSVTWMLKRVDQVVDRFPFRLNGCEAATTQPVLGVLGGPIPKDLCPRPGRD